VKALKGQTSIILAIIFAIIVAIFAVINVEAVPVNFLFVTNEAPLILVILFSVLMGSIITGAFGFVKVYKLQKEIKMLKSETNNHHEVELTSTDSYALDTTDDKKIDDEQEKTEDQVN
jgi:lipopolysaccharide assembly protein A